MSVETEESLLDYERIMNYDQLSLSIVFRDNYLLFNILVQFKQIKNGWIQKIVRFFNNSKWFSSTKTPSLS